MNFVRTQPSWAVPLNRAREIVAVQVLQEADADNHWVTVEERKSATLSAGGAEAHQPAGVVLPGRTERLLRDQRRAQLIADIHGEASVPWRWWALLAGAVLIALTLGFLSNQLGRHSVINLLSIPMLGLLTWNAFIYASCVFFGLRQFFARISRGPANSRPAEWQSRWWERAMLRWSGVPGFLMAKVTNPLSATEVSLPEPLSERERVLAKARPRFGQFWLKVLRVETTTWTNLIFHLSAISLALGCIGGMYVRGLAYEYTAAWESTFLSAPSVERVLNLALGPAATLLGEKIPPSVGSVATASMLSASQSMEALNVHAQAALPPAQREKAARWIHFYAITGLGFIGLPRLFLAFLSWRQWRRLDQTSFALQRELSQWHLSYVREATGRATPVTVWSFSHTLTASRRAQLTDVLRQWWGQALEVQWPATVPYGEEDQALVAWDMARAASSITAEAAQRVVLIMSFSATPESEVHGTLIKRLSQLISDDVDDPEDASLIIALDTESFRKQFETLPEFDRRWRERRLAWERAIETPIEAAFSEAGGFCLWRRLRRKNRA
jgi:hypothetical protein